MTYMSARQDDDTERFASERSAGFVPRYDLVCFSHLRWDFVFQRPQHLITRFSKHRRVFYVEEALIEDVDVSTMRIVQKAASLFVVTPVLARSVPDTLHEETLRSLVDHLLEREAVQEFGILYYTPMALPFTRHLDPVFIAYDCMDELSSFRNAPLAMRLNEKYLLQRADIVFTGGWSLFESKRTQHPNVHALPSSIDAAHFRRARNGAERRPVDTQTLHLGFFGVIDERFDCGLMAGVAALRPNWDITLVGPVVKIDPASLPASGRLRYPGMASYDELPQWLAQWDVAIMPFARNESTRFISPTKTPEYLAGGKPVVSTSIHDVVHPYATLGLVHIADLPEAFVAACERATRISDAQWLARVDEFLLGTSWDRTWLRMATLIDDVLQGGSSRARVARPRIDMSVAATAS